VNCILKHYIGFGYNIAISFLKYTIFLLRSTPRTGIAESAYGVVLEPDNALSDSYDNAVRTGFVVGDASRSVDISRIRMIDPASRRDYIPRNYTEPAVRPKFIQSSSKMGHDPC
jgi:hypothetical protein